KTTGGDVKYAAGDTVWLVPYSPHADSIFSLLSQLPGVEEKDCELVNMTARREVLGARAECADGEGHFQFLRVLPGNYFVVTCLTWMAYSEVLQEMHGTGGVIV